MEEVQKISQSCRGSDQLFRDLENKGCEEELNALGLFKLREATQQVSAMERTAEKRKRITCLLSAMGTGQWFSAC